MSEPLTPDQAMTEERLAEWEEAIPLAAQDANAMSDDLPKRVLLRLLGGLQEFLRDARHKSDLIRTLAARNAELEDTVKWVQTAKDRTKTDVALAQDFAENELHTRIRELEEAARWRSCKDEPPGELREDQPVQPVAVRKRRPNSDKFFDPGIAYPGRKWIDSEGCEIDPDEWKPIV